MLRIMERFQIKIRRYFQLFSLFMNRNGKYTSVINFFFFSLCPDLMYIHYLGTTKEPRFLKMLLHLQENIFKAMFYLLKKVHVSKGEQSEVSQLCPALCGPMDCSLPCSPVRGIFQARVLEWAAISFSRGSSQPRDRTRVSRIVGRRFTI